jgi:hypothetical protein
LGRIQARHAHSEFQADAVFLVKTGGFDEDPILRHLSGEVVLGKVRPIDRRLGIGGENRDVAAEALLAEALRRRKPRGAATNDNETADELGLTWARLGLASFSRTKMWSPTVSTRQVATGSKAGARIASPVRRLKQAWCQGQRTVSPDSTPLPRGPP